MTSATRAAIWARQYRAEHPEVVERRKALQIARRRALARLARRYPADLAALVAVECERLDVDPPGTVPVGRKPRMSP